MYCSNHINSLTRFGKQRLVGEILYGDFCGAIKEIFKEYRIGVEYIYSDSIKANDLALGGYYEFEDDSITLELIVSPNSSTVIVKEAEWQGFAFLLSQTVQHELIHRYQYTVRPQDVFTQRFEYFGGLSTENRDYYSEDDEIHAYAHCLALELNYKYKGKRLEKVLRNPNSIRGCDTWNTYKRVFKGFDWEDIRRALLKHTIKWLPSAVPYKDKD